MYDVLSWSGLGVFILGILVSIGTLFDDGHRVLAGEITITVWATQKPYRAVLIVLATCLIPLGLFVHFYFFSP